jgi:hypothetical protein
MSLWSPQQLEWLRALDCQPLQLAGAAEAVVAPAAPAPTTAPSREGHPRLHAALLHAGRGRPGVEALVATLDLPALRADAGAKRALWPRLRALLRN